MVDIYTLKPINRTAERVVGQEGCTSHEGLTLEQQRKNLIAKKFSIMKKREDRGLSKESKKSLGQELCAVEHQLQDINKLLKRKNQQPSVAEEILRILKKRMTKFQWDTIVKEARENYNRKVEEEKNERVSVQQIT